MKDLYLRGCRGSFRFVHLVPRKNCPSDSRELVGNGDNEHVFVGPLLQPLIPARV
jgi:hypothetical protein